MNNPYRVLLVDDEPIILRSLKVVIPWEELGMTIVGEARNGAEALALAGELHPHLILCDIRMPIMDGITLMKEVMSDNSSIIFIILSGYGEFEYAREAIRQGAFDYLLKPIDHEELESVIKEALKRLDSEQSEHSEHEYLRKSVQALSSLVREQMLAEILFDANPTYDRLYWLKEWELEYPYHMVIVSLDDYDHLCRIWNTEEKKLWLFAIRNILLEFGDEQQCLTQFPFHSGEWIMIFQKMETHSLMTIGQTLIELIRIHTKLSCSVGISDRYSGLNQLNESYQDAQFALARRFIQGQEKVHTITKQDKKHLGTQLYIAYLHDMEKILLKSLQTLDVTQFDLHMNQLEEQLASQECTKEETIELLYRLSVLLHRQMENMGVCSVAVMDDLLQSLMMSETLGEMLQVVRSKFIEWMELANSVYVETNGGTLITKATDYIGSRYHYDLGIDEVSEFIGISCSHFCVLFKQETGFTFLEYVTKIRIEKACAILRNSDVKVYQVAPLVGYQDPRYFTQVFKKMMHMTPTEYRTAQVNGV